MLQADESSLHKSSRMRSAHFSQLLRQPIVSQNLAEISKLPVTALACASLELCQRLGPYHI
jgi:hypothetical protein